MVPLKQFGYSSLLHFGNKVMSKNTTSSLIAALGLIVAVASGAASANTDLTKVSGFGQAVSSKIGTTSTTDRWMGSMTVKDDLNNQFLVYCIDPLTSTNWTSNTYSTKSLDQFMTGANGTGTYTDLFNSSPYTSNSYATGNASTRYDDANTNTSTVLTKLKDLYSYAYADSQLSTDKAAAFQYAIWEVLGDGPNTGGQVGGLDYDRTTGGMRSDANNTPSAFDSALNTYLAGLNGSGWGGLAYTQYSFKVWASNPLGSGGTQSFLQATRNGVPEPGTLALTALAVFGLAAARKRANKQH